MHHNYLLVLAVVVVAAAAATAVVGVAAAAAVALVGSVVAYHPIRSCPIPCYCRCPVFCCFVVFEHYSVAVDYPQQMDPNWRYSHRCYVWHCSVQRRFRIPNHLIHLSA
eukprot:219137_1